LVSADERARFSVRFAPKRGARTSHELRALLGGAAAAIVSTVDEGGVGGALCEGRLRGAGLDVFSRPAVTPVLAALANVVLIPHVAGLSE
jgi:hypothetical protein